MPIISRFFGIIIRMFFGDHAPPHFHAEYQGHKAFIRIGDGEIEEGYLPKAAARLVRDWALDHQAELMANWDRAVAFEPVELIPGADQDD